MKFYIAGPMRGLPFFNFPAFDSARDRLLALGHEAVSPADIDRANGFDAMALDPSDPCTELPPGLDTGDVVARDLEALRGCDAVCLIGRIGTGAAAELAVAKWLGKPLYELYAYDSRPVGPLAYSVSVCAGPRRW